MRVGLPDIRGPRSPHFLTAGLKGTRCTRGGRKNQKIGSTYLHRHPCQPADRCSLHSRSPNNNSSGWRGLCTSTGIWEGASERGSWGKLTHGCQSKQTTCSTNHAHNHSPAQAGDSQKPHNLAPGQTQRLKRWLYPGSQ